MLGFSELSLWVEWSRNLICVYLGESVVEMIRAHVFALALVVAARAHIENERIGSARKFTLGPEGFDQRFGVHTPARANVEAGIAAELCIDCGFEAIAAEGLAGCSHHFEYFVAVDFSFFNIHRFSVLGDYN